MRKIIVFLVSTADGFHEGANGEFDWPNVDEEFREFSVAQLGEVDTLLFGRATYEVMASYWPTPEAERNDPAIAPLMNEIAKVVVSTTLDRAEWNNSRIIRSDVAERVAELKDRPGKDIAIFGSSALVVSLLREGLIDEVRIMVMPIALGSGNPLFTSATGRIGLSLADTRVFKSGNVLLTYEPTDPAPRR